MSRSDRYPSILLFGGPGAGKGTQGAVIGQMPNLVHLAMGDIFRAIDKKSPLGEECQSYSTKGHLVPDELTIRVFKQHVGDLIEQGKLDLSYHTLILDGIPRTTAQVDLLDDVIHVLRLIHLVVDDRDALVARLRGRATKANRADDSDDDVIRKRIEIYERETHPVLEKYPKKLIAKVNADQPPLAVLRDVADCLVHVVSPKI